MKRDLSGKIIMRSLLIERLQGRKVDVGHAKVDIKRK